MNQKTLMRISDADGLKERKGQLVGNLIKDGDVLLQGGNTPFDPQGLTFKSCLLSITNAVRVVENKPACKAANQQD